VIDSGSVLGLGSIGERMLILLDIERLMSAPEMGLASDYA
jgi:purine-binding chemotaxis protein CheW